LRARGEQGLARCDEPPRPAHASHPQKGRAEVAGGTSGPPSSGGRGLYLRIARSDGERITEGRAPDLRWPPEIRWRRAVVSRTNPCGCKISLTLAAQFLSIRTVDGPFNGRIQSRITDEPHDYDPDSTSVQSHCGV